jgi:hypothetical protein
LLSALVLREFVFLEYRRLPFAASYVQQGTIATQPGLFVLACIISVYTVAWIEHAALSTTSGTVALFAVTAGSLAAVRGIDAWQRRDAREVELDEAVEPPTLRLGLTD